MSIVDLELLSPAKNLDCGMAAIDCGADAVYIGAPKFGARTAAGNSLETIKRLLQYAREFHVKVYVTVNTILFDNELQEVSDLIYCLHDMNVDAIIIQDTALLEMPLPPIKLFASTQMHNYDPERIRFLDSTGISRIILARELSLEQIKGIKKSVSADLEFFVHGALCVCFSGQCYMSAAMFGRSANRGECAQPCRLRYSLIDVNGKTVVSDKHLLSLRDLNLSAYLNDLIEAGITSFKIEGRLKDVGYVKNITAYYRQKLDSIILNNPSLRRSSSGYSRIRFEPDPDRTFNRGYTSYFLAGKKNQLSSQDTPKSTGKYLGEVIKIGPQGFMVDTAETIVKGDGLCFFDPSGELYGMQVDKTEQNNIFTNDTKALKLGTKIYRNYDHRFNADLQKECTRKIRVGLTVTETESGLRFEARDEDGITAHFDAALPKMQAEKGEKAKESFINQLMKSGNTIFKIERVDLNISVPLFFPLKTINEFRRSLLKLLGEERIKSMEMERGVFKSKIPGELIKVHDLDYKWNVVNKKAEQFYRNHGVREVDKGFELGNDYSGKTLMTCKYCIKDEIGCCPDVQANLFNEPLFLVGNKKKYRLVFDCSLCRMHIVQD
jgi:23S rRNA 5-hydroxycytidine C2501 synthase